jgi:plasmid stability protein
LTLHGRRNDSRLEETHRALNVRAVQHDRSMVAEIKVILEEAVRPESRVKPGSAPAAFLESNSAGWKSISPVIDGIGINR